MWQKPINAILSSATKYPFHAFAFSILLLFSFSSEKLYAVEAVELNEEESVIVALKLKRLILTDALIAYQNVDYTLVPFEDFLTALDYPIEVNSEEGAAHGWFVSDNNTFSLDIAENEVYIRGQKYSLPENFYYASDEWGLYIDIQIIGQWFDMNITFLMDRLQLEITTDVVQPIEKKLERQRRQEKKRDSTLKSRTYPVVNDSYAFATYPGFDAQISFDHSNVEDSASYSLQGVGDILYHETRINHSASTKDIPSSARVTFYRDAVQSGDDIFLGVTEYQFGDIYSQGDNLVAQAGSGRGFELRRAISNSLDASFSERDIEGDAPPGWEVELYHNELLIDFLTVDSSGRYIFENVALQYGENLIEVRIYGPQGQERIKTDRFTIGSELITPGEWQFTSAYVEEDKQLVDDPVAISLSDSARLFSASAYYGLFDLHSIGAGVNTVERLDDGVERDYLRAMWISGFANVSARLEVAKDLYTEGDAHNIEIAGRTLKQNFNITHRAYKKFASPINDWGRIEQETEFNIFGNIASRGRSMPYAFSFGKTQSDTGLERFRAESRVSFSSRSYRISHQLIASMDNTTWDPRSQGILSMAFGALRNQTRISLNYDANTFSANSLAIAKTINKRDWRYQLQVNKSFVDEGVSTFNLNASRLFDKFTLSFTGYADSEDQYAVGLVFEVGAYTQARLPFIRAMRPGAVNSGKADIKVFMDNDADGTFSQGDETLSGIKFKGRHSWESLVTDENGELTLTDIDVNEGTVVHLDRMTLQDPYLQPRQTSLRVMSHAGGHQSILFPINETSEVEGIIKARLYGKEKGVGGIVVALFDSQGNLVKKTTTEFDGYYLFSSVIPGSYYVNVIDEDQVMTNYSWAPSEAFQTNLQTGVAEVETIVLEKKSY